MTPQRLAAETAELDGYYEAGYLAMPPSDKLRESAHAYKVAWETYRHIAQARATAREPEDERTATTLLLLKLPDLLEAHSSYMLLLTNAVANGSVVNSLRTCGFDINPVPSKFSTVEDLLGTDPNNERT